MVPCLFTCSEGNAQRYKSLRLNRSQSSQIVEIILIGIEAYHTIDNDLGLMYARHEFQHLYNFLEKIITKHKIALNRVLKRRLLITAWVLIVLNILHAILEVVFLFPIVMEEMQRNEKSTHNTTHNKEPYIDMPERFNLYLTLGIKAYGAIHSKALDTLIIYFSFLLIYYMKAFGLIVKELVDSRDNYDSNAPNNNNNSIETKRLRSFDELRQSFDAFEELVHKTNDCLSPCILLTNVCNIFAIFGGIFIGVDIVGQGAKLEEEEAFQLLNAVVCIICVFFRYSLNYIFLSN